MSLSPNHFPNSSLLSYCRNLSGYQRCSRDRRKFHGRIALHVCLINVSSGITGLSCVKRLMTPISFSVFVVSAGVSSCTRTTW